MMMRHVTLAREKLLSLIDDFCKGITLAEDKQLGSNILRMTHMPMLGWGRPRHFIKGGEETNNSAIMYINA